MPRNAPTQPRKPLRDRNGRFCRSAPCLRSTSFLARPSAMLARHVVPALHSPLAIALAAVAAVSIAVGIMLSFVVN